MSTCQLCSDAPSFLLPINTRYLCTDTSVHAQCVYIHIDTCLNPLVLLAQATVSGISPSVRVARPDTSCIKNERTCTAVRLYMDRPDRFARAEDAKLRRRKSKRERGKSLQRVMRSAPAIFRDALPLSCGLGVICKLLNNCGSIGIDRGSDIRWLSMAKV